MANWYNKGKELLAGNFSWTTNDYRVLLVKSGFAYNPDHNFVSDISANESNATDYVRKVLAGKSITKDDTNDRVALIATDLTWTGLGGAINNTIVGAIVFKFNASDAAAELVAFIDTNDIVTADNDVTLDFDATNGLLRIN